LLSLPSSLSWPCSPPRSLEFAQCKSTSKCTHSEYTTITKLILSASKRVNDGSRLAIGPRPRAVHRQRALSNQDGREVLMWSEEAGDGEAEPSLGSIDHMMDQLCRKLGVTGGSKVQ
jgi:hypothetical protein